MDDLLSLADEIFGRPQENIGDPHLAGLARLLAPMGVVDLCLTDAEGRMLATSGSHCQPDLPQRTQSAVQDASDQVLVPGDQPHVMFPLHANGEDAHLVVNLAAQKSAATWIPPNWLLPFAELYLHGVLRERVQRREAEELRQLRTEHEVMRQEHHQLLLANLREHNARLEEQSQHLQVLERQVQERTHELTTASEEIAARNRELEEANDRLEMQIRRRQRTEEALRESAREAKRLAVVAAKTSNLVAILDERGRIDWVNDSFAITSGFSIEDCIGRDPLVLLKGPETNLETLAYIRERMRLGQFTKIDLLQYTHGGRPFWNALEIQPVFSDQGKVASFILIGSDVTQELETSKLLKDARDAAEKAARMKAEFLANMSHEVRSPLTAILGHTDILLSEEDLDTTPPERVRSLNAIKRNGVHLLSVVNDILDFSKMDAAEVELETISCNTDSFINDVVQSMLPKASEKGIALSIEYLTDVPSQLRTDPTRLSQITLNLLSNAIKFTSQGTVTMEVQYFEKHAGPQLQIAVRDSGIGMTPEQIKGLFTPFYQADASTTRQYGGTGLGLSITKRLVDLFHGVIQVTSKPNVGTTFTVTVPIGVEPNVPMISRHASQPTTSEVVPTSLLKDLYSQKLDARVLVAEDRLENQELIRHVLGKAGAEVTIVDNGNEVLELFSSAPPDRFPILLLDMQMPILDGYQCASRLREMAYPGTIVALTAHATLEDEGKCLKAGCDVYISKPIDWERLFDIIRRATWTDKEPIRVANKQEVKSKTVDWSVLIQDCAVDEAFAMGLITKFSRRVLTEVPMLQNHFDAGEFSKVQAMAHGLKGTAATLGVPGIYKAAGSLEKLLVAEDFANARLELLHLATASHELVEELNRHEPQAQAAH